MTGEPRLHELCSSAGWTEVRPRRRPISATRASERASGARRARAALTATVAGALGFDGSAAEGVDGDGTAEFGALGAAPSRHPR